jgi:hypothetical protein
MRNGGAALRGTSGARGACALNYFFRFDFGCMPADEARARGVGS